MTNRFSVFTLTPGSAQVGRFWFSEALHLTGSFDDKHGGHEVICRSMIVQRPMRFISNLRRSGGIALQSCCMEPERMVTELIYGRSVVSLRS